MNVNRKFDRLRQWGKEKMGGEVKTTTSEDFKALEAEMSLRHDGLEKMHSSMGYYVKSLGKRVEGDGKDKSTVMSHLASSMIRHADDFEDGAKFGQCLSSYGLAHQRIARVQESYTAQATSTWLDALERSLAQMRDYQTARKKLDSRRLAYDTSLAKMQKVKKEDYRAEEELRSQKAKFDESTEDVQRRMQDIIESEQDDMKSLYAFLEAELSYHDRCREILLRLQKDWPIGASRDTMDPSNHSRGSRPREVSLSSVQLPDPGEDDGSSTLRRPSVPFHNSSRTSSANCSPHREPMPALSRTTTSELYPSRAQTPLSVLSSHDGLQIVPVRSRQNSRTNHPDPVFAYADPAISSSPEQHSSFWETYSATRSSSPATTASFATSSGASASESRKESWSTTPDSVRSGAFSSNNTGNGAAVAPLMSVSGTVKKAPPPPPPPSRATKPRPPPPPPPLKRSALSTSAVPYAV